MTDDERVAAGITKTLPRSLPQALEYLDEDKELVQELGETFVTSYCHVKKKELDLIGAWDHDQRKKWMIERY